MTQKSETGPLVLVIEDHDDIAEIIEYNLRREGFQIARASDGLEGLEKVDSAKPSLVLLDLMLPKKGGLDVCREIRKNKDSKELPVIMLTAKGEEQDIVTGLECGADDYLSKPFSPKELIARIRSVLRRTNPTPPANILRIGELLIDSDRHEVKFEGKSLALTLAEFKILKTLASQPGRVFTRDQLIGKMTDGEAAIIDRNIDVHVSSLRKKMDDDGSRILTVRGVGYRFAE